MSHILKASEVGDRRVRKTQAAIHKAFSSLLLERGFDDIAIGDITMKADISRSTFYQHFSGKDELLCITLRPMLRPLADAVVSETVPELLPLVADHFWTNRLFARAIFAGSTKAAVTRALADEIAERLGASDTPLPLRLVSVHLAAGQLALLEEWLSGRHRCPPATLAGALHASSHAALRGISRFNLREAL